MHRKEVDRNEFESVREGLSNVVETTCNSMSVTEGRHEDHGRTILIRQAGRFFIDADVVTRIRPKGSLQPDERVVHHDPDQEGGEFF